MSRLRNIAFVRQEHPDGCVIACLAMIAGKTFAEVAAEYPWFEQNGGVDLESVGADFLWRHGFAWQVVYPYQPGPPVNAETATESRARRARSPWPPKPWARAHLCMVIVKGGSGAAHCIVMLHEGTVLDPLTGEPRSLDGYERVYNVRGIFDLQSSPWAGRASELAERLLEPLRVVAREHGYALAVHGSLARDIDLIAAPWSKPLSPAPVLIAAPWSKPLSPAPVLAEALRVKAEEIVGCASNKDAIGASNPDYFYQGCPGGSPHGRLNWTFHLRGGPYIDLSVMPRGTDAEAD